MSLSMRISPIYLSIICISVHVKIKVITFLKTFLLTEKLIAIITKFQRLLPFFINQKWGLLQKEIWALPILLENLVGQKGVFFMLWDSCFCQGVQVDLVSDTIDS